MAGSIKLMILMEKMNAGAVRKKKADCYNIKASLPALVACEQKEKRPLSDGVSKTVEEASMKRLNAIKSQTVPKTVEEWVTTTTLYTAKPPFGPLKPVEDPSSQVAPIGVYDLEASRDEEINASGPKKRFGKSRKKPALEDSDDIEHNVGMEHASKEYLESYSLSSRLESTLSDTSVLLAPTLLPSHSSSLLSLQLQLDSHSQTPSTQNSTACQDLLTETDIASTYPVISPTPAENGRSGGLVDTPSASAPRASYAAVAKRGTGAALKSKGSLQDRTYGETVSTNQPEAIKQTATNPSSIVPTADTDTFW
ncbi:MAG: hypothetical protein Q9223_000478 [Gallowayella weberi]